MQRLIPIEYRVLASITFGLCVLGTVVYHYVEKYEWLDSLYMSVITLATVGYGDYVPHTNTGKIFTIFYVLIGMGILVSFVTIISKVLIDRRIDTRLRHDKH